MRIFEADAWHMMTRVIDPARPSVFLDVGANIGKSIDRICEKFPLSTIHAFEPVPDVFAELQRRTAHRPNVRLSETAVGDREGSVEMRVTADRQMSSVLPSSEMGRCYHGAGMQPSTTHRARITRLDDWAAQQNITRVDAIKIDVQGLELAVLRGAERLLRKGGVVAVNCEAQLVPEYEGASTFGEIDAFLRFCGFSLYQIHDVWVHGPEERTTCVDALWLRNEAFARLPREPERLYEIDWRKASRDHPFKRALEGALARYAADGRSPVAIYGAGYHTRTAVEALASPPVRIDCIIDDDPSRQGTTLWNFPIISREQALRRGVLAVILSANSVESLLWDQCATFLREGVEVRRLYPPGRPERHERLNRAIRRARDARLRRLAIFASPEELNEIDRTMLPTGAPVIGALCERDSAAPSNSALESIPLERAAAEGIDGVILCCPFDEPALLARTIPLRHAGVRVFPTYWPPEALAARECLAVPA